MVRTRTFAFVIRICLASQFDGLDFSMHCPLLFTETVWNYEEWAMRWAGFLNAVFTTHSFKMCVKPVFQNRVDDEPLSEAKR